MSAPVLVVSVVAFIGSENATAIVGEMTTPVLPSAGEARTTDGAVTSAAADVEKPDTEI